MPEGAINGFSTARHDTTIIGNGEYEKHYMGLDRKSYCSIYLKLEGALLSGAGMSCGGKAFAWKGTVDPADTYSSAIKGWRGGVKKWKIQTSVGAGR